MLAAGHRSDSSSLALDRLRALLDSAPPGADQRLPSERTLAEDLGVGRRALRRALEVLEAEGRIWRHQGKGTFAGSRPVTPGGDLQELSRRTNPLEVMEVRVAIEPVLARLAALRASNGDVERLQRIAARIGASSDADGRELWDGALHRAVAETAGNSLLLAIFDMIDRIRQDAAWRNLRERARSRERRGIYLDQHRGLIAAIEAREAHAAERVMREHLELVRDSLLAVMTGPATEADAPVRDEAVAPAELRYGT